MSLPRSIIDLVVDKAATNLLARLRRRAKRSNLFRGIVVPVDDLIGEQIMATGMFEATHIEGAIALVSSSSTVAKGVNKEGIFVDVGANIGLYSIALAKYFRRVLAVEANPQTFKILEANLALKGLDNVTPICVGASDRDGEASIYVPLNGNLGWATLGQDHHSVPVKSIPISLRTLDNIIDGYGPVALLKIDVEGHELAVLRGARAVLSRDHPIVLFEVLNADEGKLCAQLLLECGYRRFFTFRRVWPAAGNQLVSIWRGLTSGIPVNAIELAPHELHHAALICAVCDT